MSATADEGAAGERLYVGLARLTRSLHDSLRELGLDGRLSRLAGDEIPDACVRLDYVVKMTEEAAHRTLDLVDDGRAIADGIADVAAHLGALQLRAGPLAGELQGAGAAIGDAQTQLRATLTALAQAQEYQDISGQVIRRVIGLVRDVESALIELLGTGVLLNTAADHRAQGLPGPVVPGTSRNGPSNGADQDDADRLLASLGF